MKDNLLVLLTLTLLFLGFFSSTSSSLTGQVSATSREGRLGTHDIPQSGTVFMVRDRSNLGSQPVVARIGNDNYGIWKTNTGTASLKNYAGKGDLDHDGDVDKVDKKFLEDLTQRMGSSVIDSTRWFNVCREFARASLFSKYCGPDVDFEAGDIDDDGAITRNDLLLMTSLLDPYGKHRGEYAFDKQSCLREGDYVNGKGYKCSCVDTKEVCYPPLPGSEWIQSAHGQVRMLSHTGNLQQ